MISPWLQAKKVASWSHYVTHLKLVAGNKHAIKDFDRELACALEDYSMAAAIEATVSAKCALFAHYASCHHRVHMPNDVCMRSPDGQMVASLCSISKSSVV